MRYLRFLIITLVLSSMLISCASFNYANTVDNTAENGAKINTLEELAGEYGLPPIEDSAENASETQSDTVYTDAEVDIDDAEQWTELEVPPTEEEAKSMEEAAVQPESEPVENQTAQSESANPFPQSSMDMSALTPMHMDAVEPTLPGAPWSSASDLVIPEPTSSPDAGATTDVQTETPVSSTADLPTIIWDDPEPQEQLPTTTFIEGTSVSPEWDMLSEYDRFLAEMGEDVKIADSVNTKSFVVSDPVPIESVPQTPVFDDYEQYMNEPPQTIATMDDGNIQWETVETEQPDTTITTDIPVITDEPVNYGPTPTEIEGMMNAETEKQNESPNGFMEFMARIWQVISGFFIKIWTWFKKLFGFGATTA